MTELAKVVMLNGKIAKLRNARKQHQCSECPLAIDKDAEYYEIVIGGGGLGSNKFPDRAHPDCLKANLRR